jgi:hypothetical protein
MDAITLRPHPATPCPAVARFTVAAARSTDLRLLYELRGDLSAILLPPPAAPGFADALWRHTCFEAFIGREDAPAYCELNFSPCRRWAAYGFADYRRRAGPELVAPTPTMVWRHARDSLHLDARVPLARLPGGTDAVLRLGVAAVIETRDGALSYWALHHPAAHPDFHHAAARTLRLEPRRAGC